MDRRLFEASFTGNVGDLLQLIIENPLVLHNVALSSGETPLHVASMVGNHNFVKELIRLRPEFIEELNRDGFSPLHIASANGYLEIVRELLNVNRSHCHLTSREKKTALHYAAIKGRTDIISELLSYSAESVEAMTICGETALHLAVKNNQFEVVKLMLQKLKEIGKEDVVKIKDERGNTVLHLTTYMKQREVVEYLLDNETISSGAVEVNAINGSGLTALDLLLLFPSEAGDRELEEILKGAGAMRAQDLSQLGTEPLNRVVASSQSPLESLEDYFKYDRGRDSPSDARTALLVIAVLITTASYQAGLSPPGGVWQDNSTKNDTIAHRAGQSILSTNHVRSFGLFLYFNSVGFYLSLFIIRILTFGFPLRLELQICMFAMICTYNISMLRMGPDGRWSILYNVFTAVFPVAIPFVTRWFRVLLGKRRCAASSTTRISSV